VSEFYQFWREDNPVYKDVSKSLGVTKKTVRLVVIGAAILIASDQIGKWRTRNIHPEFGP
jgi:hypothetical protein